MSHVHPMFVHFPIALILVASLLDVIAIVGRRERMEACVGGLWLLAIAGAVAGLITGDLAADALMLPEGAEPEALEHHHLASGIATALAGAVVLWRVAMRLRLPKGWLRGIYVALIVAACAAIGATGFFGGKLVYGEGIPARTVSPAATPEAPSTTTPAAP